MKAVPLGHPTNPERRFALSKDDLILLKKAQKGDISAFEQLVASNQGHIYNLCYRMMHNAQDAEDMAQEALLKAWRNLKRFNAKSSFSTWLHRIAVNTCLDRLRKNKAKMISLQEMDEVGQTITDERATHLQERSAERQQIKDALKALPPKHRAIIILRDVQGYSYEEIAEILGCPMGTVRSRLARARNKMTEFIKTMEQTQTTMRQKEQRRVR